MDLKGTTLLPLLLHIGRSDALLRAALIVITFRDWRDAKPSVAAHAEVLQEKTPINENVETDSEDLKSIWQQGRLRLSVFAIAYLLNVGGEYLYGGWALTFLQTERGGSYS